MWKPAFSSINKSKPNERGQVFVLFIVFSVLIFASAVGAIDLGTYVRASQKLETAVDSAALAGGLELPDSGTAATAKALEYIAINNPNVDLNAVTTTFRCLVGDRNGDGYPDSSDIPGVCDPGTGYPWTCANGLCMAFCTFTGSNRCNVIVVEAQQDVPLIFTTLLGMPPLQITASRTGACKGPCGGTTTVPLDVVIIIDRSGSMSSADISNVKNAALASLEVFNPDYQYVGLAVLGAGDPGDPCNDRDPSSGGEWLVVPLSNDYKNPDGTINTSSDLVSTIDCLETSSQGTNLGSPLSDSYFGQPDALGELLGSGRDVAKGIIFMSDGEANEPTSNSCAYANDRATTVKNESIEIFTIGYGISDANCNDNSGAYDNESATELLADMATDSADDHGGCDTSSEVNAENTDGDHFLCEARGSDLESVFTTAASALAGGIRLIAFPEP
jgi:hypothetical protein